MSKLLISSVHHVALICSDYAATKKFYTELLGFEIISEFYRAERDSYKLDLRLANTQIEIFSFPGAPDRPSKPEASGLRHLAFATPDIEQSVAYLEANNIEVEPIRVDKLTGKRYTFFPDPDQLPLELYEE